MFWQRELVFWSGPPRLLGKEVAGAIGSSGLARRMSRQTVPFLILKVPWTQDVVVETMEALLIESLKPPLNRKRGDNLSGIEYIQAIDPQIDTARRRAILEELRKGAGL
jgi:hypothetical protein